MAALKSIKLSSNVSSTGDASDLLEQMFSLNLTIVHLIDLTTWDKQIMISAFSLNRSTVNISLTLVFQTFSNFTFHKPFH